MSAEEAVDVSVEESGETNRSPKRSAVRGAEAGAKAQPRARAHARTAVRWVLGALRGWWARRGERLSEAERAAPDPDRRSMWTQAPASLADLWAWTKAGGWAPGERDPFLEGLGRVYGCFVIAVAAPTYAVVWVLARPTRLFGVLAFGGLLWLSVVMG